MDDWRGEERRRVSVPYEPPEFEVISLSCEISSYAPDGEEPPL